MTNIRLDIEGLEQNETQEKVKNQLEGMIGVHDVILSAGQTYLEVDYDEQTSDAEIRNHLKNNGYNIIDIESLS